MYHTNSIILYTHLDFIIHIQILRRSDIDGSSLMKSFAGLTVRFVNIQMRMALVN